MPLCPAVADGTRSMVEVEAIRTLPALSTQCLACKASNFGTKTVHSTLEDPAPLLVLLGEKLTVMLAFHSSKPCATSAPPLPSQTLVQATAGAG